MTDPILEVSGLCKHFGGIAAAEDVNLAIETGQTHAVIGPNGAGKTTLIAQLCGQIKPDRGDIRLAGQSILNHSVAQRARAGLARTFQITSLLMSMTVLENVTLAVQGCHGHSFRFWLPFDQDKSMQASGMHCLAEVGLQHRAADMAANLSHGEQRQLEVAMALAMKPRILLLDEPMAGMGSEESAAMVALLNRLKTTTTILLVEHDMGTVFSLADRLSVMVSGRIIATDSVANIRQNPEVRKAYLGENNA